MKMHCPHCGVSGSADDSYIGRKVRCPKCQKVFRFGEEQHTASSEPESPSNPVSSSDERLHAGTVPPDTVQESVETAEPLLPGQELPPVEQEDLISDVEISTPEPELDQLPVAEVEENEPVGEDEPVAIPPSPTGEGTPEPFVSQEHIEIPLTDAAVMPEGTSEEPVPEKVPEEVKEEEPAITAEPVAVEDSAQAEPEAGAAREMQNETVEAPAPPAVEAVVQQAASGALSGTDGSAEKSRTATAAMPAPGKRPHPDFTIGEALNEAWQRTKGMKGTAWAAMGVMYLALIILAFGLLFLQKTSGLAPESMGETWLGIGVDALNSAVSTLFSAGLMYLGVCLAAGKNCSWKMVAQGFPSAWPLLVASILMTLLIASGLVLLILPGIYLAVGYAMTLPLILDRSLGPWEAMEKSRKAIHKVWWKVFGTFLVMGLITAVSAIPLGIGLIWTLPMNIVLCGVVYRYLFGVKDTM